MAKKITIENSFDGGAAGGGNMNYGGSYGTPNSSTQDPSKFSSSDKTTNHMASNSESTSSAMMQPPDRPDRKGRNSNTMGADASSKESNQITGYHTDGKIGKSFNTVSSTPDTGDTVRISKPNTVSPAANYDIQKSQKPLDPDKQFEPQVDQLFKGKKQTPSPDEIMSAIQYELGNMVKKDKVIAKQTVLKNMKSDPHYYSTLQMLNIDDKKMKVDEVKSDVFSKFSKTKAVLDEMVAERQKQVAIANTPEINKIFKDLSDRRKSSRNY